MSQAAWEAAMRDGGNVSYCPVCSSQGDAPCRWPDGRPRKANHEARNRRTNRIGDRRAFARAVKDAARGWCVGTPVCAHEKNHRGQHAHHVLSRARGGADEPENGVWVCWQGHDWIHAHPAEAANLGLLKSRRIVNE